MDGQGRQLAAIERPLDTFRHETWVLTGTGFQRLAIPPKASIAELVDARVIVQLDEAWTAGGVTFTPGSLAQLALEAVKADPADLRPKLVGAHGPPESLGHVPSTPDSVALDTLAYCP